MSEQKTVKLGDFYNTRQLRRASLIYARLGPDDSKLKEMLRDKIVNPALPHINKFTGQENDPDFLAYQLIHLLGLRVD